MTEPTDLSAYAATARAWLEANAQRTADGAPSDTWGVGPDDISIFHDLSAEQEGRLLDEAMAWQQRKFDAGYGAIEWPASFGGAGLSGEHAQAYAMEEVAFEVPAHHETFGVTLDLVAPTVRAFGTDEQQRELIPRFIRTAELCCQLFSEPGAGSDLAGLATKAVRDDDGWVVSGQKIWSSGARFSAWGELIARTDSDVPKHAGQTAFIIPMDLPGITVVPIRQMSGGASFNEVFFDDVRVCDRYRLGGVGDGWRVALTTLGFERSASTRRTRDVGASWERLVALAQWLGQADDPIHRQRLAGLYSLHRIREFQAERARAPRNAGATPGPEGSLSKLLWTRWMTGVAEAAAALLGPRLTADTGEWGTFAWNGQLLGAPGYRIAGGSDEVQHNIIGERVLGLPGEPRVDRDVAFRLVPR
jgi:alkylation response protein AidB-like acyl-CoA dehydrogenase